MAFIPPSLSPIEMPDKLKNLISEAVADYPVLDTAGKKRAFKDMQELETFFTTFTNKLAKTKEDRMPIVFHNKIMEAWAFIFPGSREKLPAMNKFVQALAHAKEHVAEQQLEVHVHPSISASWVQINIGEDTTFLVSARRSNIVPTELLAERMELQHKTTINSSRKLLRVIVCRNEASAQQVNDLKLPQGVVAWSPDMYKKQPEQSTGRATNSDTDDDAPPSPTTRTFNSWFANHMLEMVPSAVAV